jgi:IS5 family transposase
MSQLGFFDFTDRISKLTEMGDPLVLLNQQINWEDFRADLDLIRVKERKNNAGAKPFDVVLMFKILVLQQLNNLSDDRLEYQIRDRISFMRFLDLSLANRVPDSKTIWLFRESLAELNLTKALFTRFHKQLANHGYIAKSGQMIDATFVEAPRQRNNREENATIKSGEIPAEWQEEKNKNMLRQKDVDARWAKKNEQNYYGYKNHINADEAHKLIQNYEITDASVHDSQMFEEILDDRAGDQRPVYADSAYRSKKTEENLLAAGIPSKICEKGAKNHPLTDAQKISNTQKSKVRCRVEHVFGAQVHMARRILVCTLSESSELLGRKSKLA